MKCILRRFLLTLTFTLPVLAQSQPQLVINQTLQTPVNAVSTTPDGRLFLLYARIDGSTGPAVVEWHSDNTTTAYPSEEWNSYSEGKDPATHLIRINSQRIGPDGALWLVDVGSPAFGAPVILPYGPKLVQVNLTTNEVQRVYPMGNVTRYNSLLDDVRFNPNTGKAYLTDAGSPGLIVLDLASGFTNRVLDNHPSTGAFMPISAEGHLIRNSQGYQYIYADQLEVSPDGQWLYYQPASGGMSRVPTRVLDQALYNSSLNTNSVLGQYVEPYAFTPSTGGTAIDAEGNIYNSDTDRLSIVKIAPDGTTSVLVQDERLLWVDAMWVDTQGMLWLPAAQLNRGTPFNNGTSHVVKPLYVYTLDIGIGPSKIDHA